MAKKKRTKKQKNTWLWLWILIGAVSGFFAFGPIGAILGIIGGIYVGQKIQEDVRRKR